MQITKAKQPCNQAKEIPYSERHKYSPEPEPFTCSECGHQSYQHSDTYNQTELTFGNVTYKQGDVIRLNFMKGSAFCDAVITGFNARGNARLIRPYLYASEINFAPLFGSETIDMDVKSIAEGCTVIDSGRTVK